MRAHTCTHTHILSLSISLRIHNIYCFSMATIVTRTPLNVTFLLLVYSQASSLIHISNFMSNHPEFNTLNFLLHINLNSNPCLLHLLISFLISLSVSNQIPRICGNTDFFKYCIAYRRRDALCAIKVRSVFLRRL